MPACRWRPSRPSSTNPPSSAGASSKGLGCYRGAALHAQPAWRAAWPSRGQHPGDDDSDTANPFYSVILRGVEDRAEKSGYAVIAGNSDNCTAREESYLNLLLSKRVDGILLIKARRNERFPADQTAEVRDTCGAAGSRLPPLNSHAVLGGRLRRSQ